MFTHRDIAPGEVVLRAPRHVALTIDAIRHSPIGLRIRKAQPAIDQHSHFAAFLLDTRRHGGYWEPLVDSIPEAFPDLPAFFARCEWSLLRGSEVQVLTRRYWQRMCRDLRAVNQVLPPGQRFALREFAWGWWASVTRGLSLSIDGAPALAMLPMEGPLDHPGQHNCRWTSSPDDGFELHATEPIVAGSRLRISCGPGSNVELLSRYGLCPDNNPDDRVCLAFAVPDSHFIHELSPGLVPRGAAVEYSIGHDLESDEARHMLSLLRVGSLPDAAAAYHRHETTEGHGRRVPALSAANECAALRVLIDGCDRRLRSFGGTIADDERLLGGHSLTARQRRAVMVRRGEKQLLNAFVSVASNTIEALSAATDSRSAALARLAEAGGPFNAYFEHLRSRLAPTARASAPTPSLAQSRDMAYHLHSQGHVSWHERNPPKVVVRGDGAYVWDEAGHRYLDAMSGLWGATLGYSEARLADAAARQLRLLPSQHTFGDRTSEPAAELAARLVQLAPCPMSKVYFACSGSEASDTAIKLAWSYWAAKGQPGRRKILSRHRAYHGSTVASASLTGMPSMHAGFGIPLPGFIHLTCPHFYREGRPGETEEAFCERLATELEETLVREGPDTVAAFFAEPVMGAGGVVLPPVGYFEKIQAVLQRHGVLLVADEVVCGFGRTGHFWGSLALGLQPDLLICAKGLTASYIPMSAVLMSEQVCDALRTHGDRLGAFGHGFTQSGHPVAAAVALEALRIYEERALVANARSMGERLGAALRRLASHPLVGEVRGLGLMWAVDLVSDKSTRAGFDPSWAVPWTALRLAENRGLIARTSGDSLLIAPPLIVGPREIDRIETTVALVLADLHELIERHCAAAQRRAA